MRVAAATLATSAEVDLKTFFGRGDSDGRTLGVEREFLRAYNHFCKMAGGPLGIGLLVVAHDDANDNVEPRCSRLFLNFFSPCKISLSC